PVSAVTVISPLAPMFDVATARRPVPVFPGMLLMPSLVGVAPSAMMSGVGVFEADTRTVSSPGVEMAEARFEQKKLSAMSTGPKARLAVGGLGRLGAWRGRLLAGWLGRPVSALVFGLVVWKSEVIGSVVIVAIPHPVAVSLPMLMIVPKKVAVPPVWIERLIG